MTRTRNLKVRDNGSPMGLRKPYEQGQHQPTDKPNQHKKFEDGTNIKYLPPKKSYKMLGVQINPMLDFRDHLKHITTEVRQLARVLTKRRLYPNRKQLVLDQLLKSKYHATHLRILIDTQMKTIDKILNKAARNALGLTLSFPTEAIHRPTKEMGLGFAPLRNKATNGNTTPHGYPQQTHR